MAYGYNVRGGTTQQFSGTGTGSVQQVTPPVGATAMLIGCETTDARVAFDNSAPAAGNGQVIKAGLQPVFFPFAQAFKYASTGAGASVLNVTWLF